MQAQIDAKIQAGERINDQDAMYLYQEAPLEALRKWATQVKTRFHANLDQATYVIMRIINYTNVCVAKCDYCSFYRLPRSPEGYLTPFEDMCSKVDEILQLGGDFVAFNGGFNPKLKLDWYVHTFSQLRQRYGDRIEFYALTVAEMMYVAKLCRLSYREVCLALKEAGVRWITGGGSEILTNGFRSRHSPQKYTADDYIQAQATILESGLNSTATMVIGFDETIEERVEHLQRVRQLQDQSTRKLFSFLSWTYKPYGNELGGQEVAPEEYLRHLAVTRIYLDNIKHIRTSVLTQNDNALRGLHFGADDFDIPLEDEVTEMAGAVINRNIEDILEQARCEGFHPVFRHMTLQQQGQTVG